jgi:hypothetical protein
MPINDRLKELLSVNQNKRLAEEKAQENRRDNPKILRHTTYQGDRKIQQLGDEIIENGVVLNNQAVEIGDVMLPLAQGNVLRRVDNTNGGELLGSAYRKAKEEDLDINGNQFSGSGVPTIPTGGGGGIGNGGGGGKLPTKSPAPSGCVQPPPTCVWSPDPSPPLGWQSYGSVTLESGTLNLYCLAGTAVSQDLGCDFLQKWACFGGVCSPNPNGSYASQSECEAALVYTQTCTVTVKTFTTAPESPTGIEATSFTYTNVLIPIGDSFGIETYADGTSFTGFSSAVKLNVSGLYYLGDNSFTSTRTRWSQRTTTVDQTCTLAPPTCP